MKKWVLVFLGLLIFPGLQYAEEFALVQPESVKKRLTQNDFFDQLNLPSVQLRVQCTKDGKTCWDEVWASGKKVITFSASDSVTEKAQGRYAKIAYLLIQRSYETGSGKKKETHKDYYLVDSTGKKTSYPKIGEKQIFQEKTLFIKDRILTSKGELVSASSEKILFFDLQGKLKKELPFSEKMIRAVLRNNPEGSIGCLAISENDELILSDTQTVAKTGIFLASKGDRMDVLSVYPGSDGAFYGVVYKYVNVFNKGLYLFQYHFKRQNLVQGHLFNSEDRNVGFSPEIYEDRDDKILVYTQDSTHNENLLFEIPKSRLAQIEEEQPSHIEGFETEELISLLGGVGVRHVWWNASSKVQKNDVTYGSVDYRFSSAWMYQGFFEGRVGDTHLGLSYLKNQTDSGSMDQTTSQFFSAFASLDGILPASTSFRVVYERGEIKGTAEFTKDNGGTPLTATSKFQNQYHRIVAMAILEKGLFFGFDYTSYQLPSAIGFSDSSKTIVYSDFDPEFKMNIYSLLVGYDMLSYAKRYEVNLSQFYSDGYFGFGLGKAGISDSVAQAAKTNTGKTDIRVPLFGSLSGSLSVGYIFQRRSKSLRGLGLVFQIGYQVKGNWMFAGQSSDSQDEKLESHQLALEMSHYDLQHGPFLQISAVW